MSSGVPLSVSEFTAIIREAVCARPELEDVLVEGEISNLSAPSSGHLYFTLKDTRSALGCVCFRTQALRVPFAAENGLKVIAHGHVEVYEQQGRYQLYVDRLEPSGLGALALAVEQRKRALFAEGLFDDRLKRPLPLLPRRLAVVTSRTGAALRDVCTVVARRAPCVDVVLSPATVQGEGAADTIIQALRRAGRVRGVEVVLLVRGGGSLEDLMAFNDESVARAIRACPVPVVSGVGHETDLTIADLAAERRSATPSAAAETVVPSCLQLSNELHSRRRRLSDDLLAQITARRAAIERAQLRLDRLSPRARLGSLRQELDARASRLRHALKLEVVLKQRALAGAEGRLLLHSPARRLPQDRERVGARAERLTASAERLLRGRRADLGAHLGRLEALSPLRVIERGYSVTVDAATGRVLTDAAEVSAGARLHTRLAVGSLGSTVDAIGPLVSVERMYDAEMVDGERAGG